jgi:bifunctional UDP-N-acetylglucosamine pyrophosphorylase/glucosamine-1-phosphate N-acetyltransferase
MLEKKFRVVILAAGLGKRMKSEVPKTLTLVGGKPILQYLVEAVKASGLERTPLVVVGRERGNLCGTFGETCDYVVQEQQLGTGHAVHVAKDAVGNADALIVLYGDHPFISAKTIQKLATRHIERGNTITIMTTTVPSLEGWYRAFTQWGRVLRGKNGHIVGIRENKDATEKEKSIRELNPALFCFDTKWLWENIERVSNKNAQGEYYLTDLIAMAVEQGQKLSSISVAPEEVIGINTQDEREIAEGLLKKRDFMSS